MSTNPLVTALASALAGTGGTIISTTATYPLLNVSTRLQVDRTQQFKGGNLRALWKVLKKEGIVKGWYAGWSTSIVINIIMQFVFYWVRKYLCAKLLAAKRKLVQRTVQVETPSQVPDVRLSVGENLACGFLAGCVAVILTQPISVVYTRQAVSRGGKGFFATLKSIIRDESLTTLYAGLLPSFMLCCNPAIQHMLYEELKRVLYGTDQKAAAHHDPMVSFSFGALAKAVATLITYPMITMKNRQQTRGVSEAVIKSAARSGSTSLIQSIRLLYRGFGAKITQSVLQSAVQFMTQEQLNETCLQLTKALLSDKGNKGDKDF